MLYDALYQWPSDIRNLSLVRCHVDADRLPELIHSVYELFNKKISTLNVMDTEMISSQILHHIAN